MPPQSPIQPSVQNSFIGGIKTEFTGLNFPENSCTDADNTVFTIVGDVIRREGFNFEANAAFQVIDRTNKAISTYKWNNVGGDGSTQLVVTQIGNILYFYKSSAATGSNPLSAQILVSTVNINTFHAIGNVNTPSLTECQYSDGNGYLFVYHTDCDPFFCTFNSNTVTANIINLQVRDFVGIPELTVSDNTRPSTLIKEHQYNLQNQGWTSGSGWVSNSNSFNGPIVVGSSYSWTIAAGLTIANGDPVQAVTLNVPPSDPAVQAIAIGSVSSYNSGTGVITLFINASSGGSGTGPWSPWQLSAINHGFINSWFAAEGNYPSNADVWWTFKDSTGTFNPSAQVPKVTLSSGAAPKGFYLLNPFIQDRTLSSGVVGLTTVNTTARPRTGTWFQGRVWYAGVDASFPPTGDEPFSTWTETIYFSQIVETTANFNKCFQVNDPTSENLFNLLPTDGGTIVIQGSGSIYKLFPIQTGMFVFAANGIWYITGSQGVGFSANDYTITKVSGVQSTSSTSFINVLGWPVFWNEEGIYEVVPSGTTDTQNNRRNFFQVNNLALGTILTLYNNIPLQSKKFARGDYNPIDYIVQWCYRDTNESSVTDRYQFNRILNFNTSNKAFYTYTIGTTNGVYVHGINYVAGPGGSTSPPPVFKYFTSYITNPYTFSFVEERDSNYIDWALLSNTSYTSFFITGYSLKGQAISKFQVPYAYIFSRNPSENEYIIQSIWDYSGTGNSGRWSTRQIIDNNSPNFTMLYRRHRLRGRGLAMQMKISSFDGKPFDIMGWALYNSINQGI